MIERNLPPPRYDPNQPTMPPQSQAPVNTPIKAEVMRESIPKVTTMKLEDEEIFALFSALENDPVRKQYMELQKILGEGEKKQAIYTSLIPIIDKKMKEANDEQGE